MENKKIDILLMQPIVPSIEAKLDSTYNVHRLHKQNDKESFLSQVGPEIKAVVTGGGLGISGKVMDALPALELIAVYGIGTDAVDMEKARSRGIKVSTTPGVLTEDVADLALGLMLAALRGISTGDRYVRAGQWGKAPLPLGRKLSGKHVGIVGLGRVGRAIAKRVAAFDCKISYSDLKQASDVDYGFIPDIHALARACDILVLAASADHGRCLVDAQVLDCLGPDSFFINVARGKLVDEPALVMALSEKRIAGAGLDVFLDEPHVPQAMLSLENVVLQPHRASATIETRTAMGQLVIDNLESYFSQGQLLTPAV